MNNKYLIEAHEIIGKMMINEIMKMEANGMEVKVRLKSDKVATKYEIVTTIKEIEE